MAIFLAIGIEKGETEHQAIAKKSYIKEEVAIACPYCNRAKATDLGSIDSETGKLTPFFNPRTQKWSDRFDLNGIEIAPLTAVGRVTAAILQFNQSERLEERGRLILGTL